VERRSSGEGLYNSVSEYIRDLVRRDYEREEEQRWELQHQELRTAMAAPDSDFVPLDAKELLAEARRRKGAN